MTERRQSPSIPKTERRSVSGILLLDKPSGWTSNAILQRVRFLYRAQKAGHGGSLDPMATGMLALCFGRATRQATALLGSDKTYVCEILLGVQTDTGDITGQAIEQLSEVPTFSFASVASVLQTFLGEMLQIPPMYSALKHQGKPLYALARQGIVIERAPRPVTIHRLELLDLTSSHCRLLARVSKGTYIRTLAEDIGRALGVPATLSALRRTEMGAFGEEKMLSYEYLSELEGDWDALDAQLMPL